LDELPQFISEGEMFGQSFIEHCAQSVYVPSCVRLSLCAKDGLRRHIRQCPWYLVLRCKWCRGQITRYTKIGQLRCGLLLALLGDQEDVGGFHIPVDDSLRVDGTQGLTHRDTHVYDVGDGQPAGGGDDVITQTALVCMLHYNEEVVVLFFEGIDDDDVAVAHPG
jgi:hypothetical protein